jgi:hypothetical protein
MRAEISTGLKKNDGISVGAELDPRIARGKSREKLDRHIARANQNLVEFGTPLVVRSSHRAWKFKLTACYKLRGSQRFEKKNSVSHNLLVHLFDISNACANGDTLASR